VIADELGASIRLRRAIASLAMLRSLVPPMTPSADTHCADVADALREYEAECVSAQVKLAHLRRSL
jgi:hypothetical protein